jgi:hypothetical protein
MTPMVLLWAAPAAIIFTSVGHYLIAVANVVDGAVAFVATLLQCHWRGRPQLAGDSRGQMLDALYEANAAGLAAGVG